MCTKVRWFLEVRKILNVTYGLMLYVVVLSICRHLATLFNLAACLSYGWSSPSLPQLFAANGPVQITVGQGTWIVASMKIGTLLTPIPVAWMMER